MIDRYKHQGLYLLLYSVGILLVGSLPALFSGISVNIASYVESLKKILAAAATGMDFTYSLYGMDRPVFPRILEPWLYSVSLLFTSFILALILAIALAFWTILLPASIRKKIDGVLFVLESLPDLLIIAMFQVLVISAYKATGFVFFNIAAYGNTTPYILPIAALSILPAIYMYRFTFQSFESEFMEPYVDLAKGKGLSRFQVLFHHILRNAFVSIFVNSKYILWFMLSNLLIVEYTFATNGLIQFMLAHKTTEIFTIGIFLFFLPIWTFLTLGRALLQKIYPVLREIK